MRLSIRSGKEAAVRGVAAQHHAAKRAEADAAERERLLRSVPLELGWDYSEAGVAAALAAIKQAFARLPVGTPVQKLEQVRDEVLAPL
jgi:hypothetical protein